MKENLEKAIMEKIEFPGWTASRGLLRDPTSEATEEEYRLIEDAMRSLAGQGKVRLWRLILEQDGSQLLAAAKPDLELDKDLEERGAWAKAVLYEE
jgi:hypothetical protein